MEASDAATPCLALCAQGARTAPPRQAKEEVGRCFRPEARDNRNVPGGKIGVEYLPGHRALVTSACQDHSMPWQQRSDTGACLSQAKGAMAGIFSRAWYHADIADFLAGGPDRVLGQLMANTNQAVELSQCDAWAIQYDILAELLNPMEGHIFWEFVIPRMGRRIDVVIFHRSALLLIEFKVGAHRFERSDYYQVWDYALDLKNFHETSHDLPIYPILVATEAPSPPAASFSCHPDGVYEPIFCSRHNLQEVLMFISLAVGAKAPAMSWTEWFRGGYKPTPTIVEAARALYARHSVHEIARSDAGAQNLARTAGRLDQLAQDAHRNHRKVICFVTGVPGSGKTLVGLDLANRTRDFHDHAVYLSGNGPLVAVLREALTRDEYFRRRIAGEKVRKGAILEGVKAFIQPVHHFRDESLHDLHKPPVDHVVIFDEAQRAWNAIQTAHFMHRKKNRPGFCESEPELLLGYMDRHRDWAMVVCLVGGGQEINTGEAGIDAWLEAIDQRFPHWDVYVSDRLQYHEYGSDWVARRGLLRPGTYTDSSLHLSVSMRSFRAENLSALVRALLDLDQEEAARELRKLSSSYPIWVTRNLDAARRWLRRVARGTERYGIITSSKAMRLKPHAIDIRAAVDPVLWFLNDREDTRSSYYLEDVATEFQVQGLELDWTCVAWDADLRFVNGRFEHFDFSGDSWKRIRSMERQRYLTNAYRVLLTRARQGMVIFVPPGDPEDPTRLPQYYDPCWDYLRSVGVRELEA